MSSDRVHAVWTGPFDGELADGSVVRRGDVIEVGAHEVDSDHLKKVAHPKKTKDDGEGDS